MLKLKMMFRTSQTLGYVFSFVSPGGSYHPFHHPHPSRAWLNRPPQTSALWLSASDIRDIGTQTVLEAGSCLSFTIPLRSQWLGPHGTTDFPISIYRVELETTVVVSYFMETLNWDFCAQNHGKHPANTREALFLSHGPIARHSTRMFTLS